MAPPPTARRCLVAVLLLALASVVAACGGGSSGGSPPGPALVYAALGASDAVGIGAIPLTNGYVYLIAERFETAGFATTLENLGINGARVEDLLADELPAALAAGPHVVTIWVGANDVIGGADPATFGARLDELLAALADGTDARIFVGDLPDLTQAPRFRDDPDPDVTALRVTAFNAEIAEAVLAHGAVLVAISTAVLTDDMFFVDGFHPNDAGHAQLAQAYWAAIVANP